jgi:hypothetical protein
VYDDDSSPVPPDSTCSTLDVFVANLRPRNTSFKLSVDLKNKQRHASQPDAPGYLESLCALYSTVAQWWLTCSGGYSIPGMNRSRWVHLVITHATLVRPEERLGVDVFPKAVSDANLTLHLNQARTTVSRCSISKVGCQTTF